MKTPNILHCIGYGYTANAFAQRLSPKNWRISGTTRSSEKADAMRARGVDATICDLSRSAALGLRDGVRAVLISSPPDENGCPAICAVKERLDTMNDKPEWIGYLSANSVYGDHAGAWVDEKSELKPATARGRRRVEAEKQWRSLGDQFGGRVVIFRLPGIYGPGRSALDTVRNGKAKRIDKAGQVFSRMHVSDIACALEASLENPRAGALFNLADDEPAPPQDVIEFACRLLGVAPPPLTPFDESELSEMAKSFYSENKRVSNRRMKRDLRVVLRYPTYREGLQAILAAGD